MITPETASHKITILEATSLQIINPESTIYGIALDKWKKVRMTTPGRIWRGGTIEDRREAKVNITENLGTKKLSRKFTLSQGGSPMEENPRRQGRLMFERRSIRKFILSKDS